MSWRESFDDAFDAAIDQVRGGRPLADVLAAHPRSARDLQPLLETSMQVVASARMPHSVPQGLAGNFTIVRAALERERAMGERVPAPPAEQTHWWQRRWTLASLSLPAGAVLFLALAGVSGAAAATVAVANSDVAQKVADFVTPDWAEDVVPDALHGGDAGDEGDGEPGNGAVGGEPGRGNGLGAEATKTVNEGQQEITRSGVISDVHGSTFSLTGGDGQWKVQYDAKTDITGAIVDGATAVVTGNQTGVQVLHATAITTDAAEDADPAPHEPGNGDRLPGGNGNLEDLPADAGDQPEVTPTPDDDDKGNGNPNGDGGRHGNGDTQGNGDGPPGQLKKTPTPEASLAPAENSDAKAPPGQANGPPGNAQASENGDGNGGGPKKP
jgi:hypothetical protein